MSPSNARVWVASLALLAGTGVAAPPDQTLAIRLTNDSYELSVPAGRLVMTIPRGDLAQVDEPHSGAAASPRYFHLADRQRGIIVTGWFEPARAYQGFETFWKSETDAWTAKGLPAPKDLSFQKIGGWDAAIYDLDVPGGSNTHIRSEWVQLGTWIDVHVSVTTAAPLETARAAALTLLNAIRVTELR